jgi:hypothetical protein
MIADTSDHTQRRLSIVTKNLQTLNLSELLSPANLNKNAIDECEYLKRCLGACIQMTESINELKEDGNHTVASLVGYHEAFKATVLDLEDFLKATDNRNIAASASGTIRSVQVDDPILRSSEQVHQQDWGSENMNVNRFEDIHVAEDGIQIISSTGNLIQAKNISAGARSMQCLGQLSDTSIVRVSGAVNRPR